VRKVCRDIQRAAGTIRELEDEWNGGMSSLIPDDGEPMDDGADTDARRVVTSTQVHEAMGELSTQRTALENNDNARLNRLIALGGGS
jgi:hypothetical protein